jgi:LuxR family maltose regulon positive regulatory protein
VRLGTGIAALRAGELGVAAEALSWAAENAPATTAPTLRADCLGRLAVVEALQGRLTRAAALAERALSGAADAGVTPFEMTAAPSVALALVSLGRGEAAGLRQHVAAARSSGRLWADPVSRTLLEVAAAEVQRADGRLDAAVDRLRVAAAAAAPADPWLADQLRLAAARVTLASGAPASTLELLEGVTDRAVPEVVVLAAATQQEQGAPPVLVELQASTRGDDTTLHARVGGLLVEALERSRQRSPGRARAALDSALRSARPEELRSPFRDASPAVRRWLAADPHFRTSGAWVEAEPRPASTEATVAPSTAVADIVEPLTAKEREVLGHLAELLTTGEIAEKMFVSVNTVRTHIRSILRKLGVSRRNAAIRRARELGILES